MFHINWKKIVAAGIIDQSLSDRIFKCGSLKYCEMREQRERERECVCVCERERERERERKA